MPVKLCRRMDTITTHRANANHRRYPLGPPDMVCKAHQRRGPHLAVSDSAVAAQALQRWQRDKKIAESAVVPDYEAAHLAWPSVQSKPV
jgi:hypothetical protein